MKKSTKQIGTEFEKEAFEILKSKFDSVEWLSEKKSSTLDFKCIKDGEVYFGDAKYVSKNKPTLKNNQKEADFVIAKINGEIKFYWKDEFFGNVRVSKEDMFTISVEKDTKKIVNELQELYNESDRLNNFTKDSVVFISAKKELELTKRQLEKQKEKKE